jgi:hypothetical protein
MNDIKTNPQTEPTKINLPKTALQKQSTNQTALIVGTFITSLGTFLFNASDILKGVGIICMTAVVLYFIHLKNRK